MQIDRALADVPTYKGTYSSNTLPTGPNGRASFKRPFQIISNTAPSYKPGQHWVMLSVPLFGPAEFFSSYGLPPDASDGILKDVTHFRHWLKSNSATGQYVWNKMSLECLEDDTCGEYCVYAVRHGLPESNRGAWEPILSKQTCQARDLAVRQITKVRPPGQRNLPKEAERTAVTPKIFRELQEGIPVQ